MVRWRWPLILLLCFQVLLVLGSAVSGDCPGACEVSFQPTPTSAQNPVTVILEGWWPDACPRALAGWHLDGTVLRFDFQSPAAGFCAMMLTPWREEALVGQLAAGSYQVEVWYHETSTGERCLMATAVLEIEGQTCPYLSDMEFGESWTSTGLWHLVDNASCVSPGYASPTHAFYFGRDEHCDYDTQEQVSGELTSPSLDLTQIAPGMLLTISWSQWREVEYFSGGAYDCTDLLVSFDYGDWELVWSADSKSPSESGWTAVTTSEKSDGMPLVVPWETTSLRVKFRFDSRDALGNDFLGWLVDDVRVCFEPAPELRIATACPLPDGHVGVGYSTPLQAEGGSRPYVWSVVGELSPGLAVTSSESDGRIKGVPGTAAQYAFSLCVTDAGGNRACAPCQISVVGGDCPRGLFYEDFSGSPEWTMTQLAHITDWVPCIDCSLLDGRYAYFGRNSGLPDGGCDFDTGHRSFGRLTTPWVPIPDCVEAVAITFDSFRHVEGFEGAYDRTWVEARTDRATTWQTIWYKDSSDASPECERVVAGLDVADDASLLQLRFRFDSVDSVDNKEPGWAIDNVVIQDITAIPGLIPSGPIAMKGQSPPREQGSEVTVRNVPNPVTNVNTTTFVVRGTAIEAVRIEVYDLALSLVFEGEAQGTELVWHTQNSDGEYLANGVYLYRALVLVGGKWTSTAFQKLVILR
ncbi:MAG: T9SS type A sorting domain-containing protein [Candidatus Bipolaricaulota bacterium]|nr:T9SS type A sorting domain-containing protein [Candidatus Bipolaricaulota bacterium]